MAAALHPGVPERLGDEEAHRRVIAETLNRVLAGRLNCTLEATLAPAATRTTIRDPRLGPASFVGWSPLTPGAAAAQAGIFIVARAAGSVVLGHAAVADTDQRLALVILG